MRTQHSLVLNRNTQNPDMGQLLWGVGANWTAHLHSADDTSEHGTQESSYHRTLTQNTALDESWRNTVGTGGIALLSVLGHTETILTYKLQILETVDAVHLTRESTIKTKSHSFISLCEMIKNDGSSVCSKFPVTSMVLHCRKTEFKQGFAVEVLFVDITQGGF